MDDTKINLRCAWTPLLIMVILLVVAAAGCVADTSPEGSVLITDQYGREVSVPSDVESVLCSGAGSLRYLVYLQAEGLAAGVDSADLVQDDVRGRPYSIVHGELFESLPLFGEMRGRDDPEKIVAISPDLIFKAGSSGIASGADAADAASLQQRTGVPVIGFQYGSVRTEADQLLMYDSLRLMGSVIGREDRAEAVIAFIDETIEDLEARTRDIPPEERKRAYVGGVGSRGAHGIISTEPAYGPFAWVHAENVASGLGTDHADIAKEALVDWDPEYLFIDLSSMHLGEGNALDQLKTDPALQGLTAVKTGNVYGVLPFNSYTTNYGTVLADAYFIGSVLYPEQFADIDPAEKADEIYSFLVGEPVFAELNSQYDGLGFSQIPI
ncbi:MAG: iron ABC transporter substrate-binding protein [Methanocalculus sp. MSAO_Arc1]|uniref:iron ABC transporter substrate-binding protein n=1 Tax=Methanocalculus TaxID=71151 RepID=UPI000FEE3179|nr:MULTISPECIES: iron ABC transporter substrate-binding protein [unclassified Methanocalculus]MCP1661692.1 iron complex transport system substrate-binding protein [Methanocalculus sp. AMF5]RQD81434.1 MAG: iron ABC transporter substrate-binding protein [Methanocalculus sp. MSAO_Arc1]